MSQDPQAPTSAQEPQASAGRAEAPSGPSPSPRPSSPLQEAAQAEAGPEAPLWTGRTHWSHYVGSLVLWLAGAVLTGFVCRALAKGGTVTSQTAFRVAAFLIGLSAIYVLGRILWRVLSCRYRLTTQRLFIERGILSQTIDQTELVRVDDVRLRRSLVDRILGLGNIEVMSTDATDKGLVIDGVRNPQVIAEHIRERMRQLRRKSLYVENI